MKNSEMGELFWKKKPASCFMWSCDLSMRWFDGILLRFHFASDHTTMEKPFMFDVVMLNTG